MLISTVVGSTLKSTFIDACVVPVAINKTNTAKRTAIRRMADSPDWCGKAESDVSYGLYAARPRFLTIIPDNIAQ